MYSTCPNRSHVRVCVCVLRPDPVPAADNGCDVRLFDLAKSVHWIVGDSTQTGGNGTGGNGSGGGGESGNLKRRRMLPGGDDSDDDTMPAPPAHDIYRLRQQKRFQRP